MPLIERRYAEALVDLAAQVGAIDEYQRDFQSVVDVFNSQTEFRHFVLNPKVKIDIKKDVLRRAFEKRINSRVMDFLLLLADKGRIKFLPGMLEEFVKLADKKRNVLNMTIISAAPLDEVQVDKIKEKYRKLYGAAYAAAKTEVDKSIIGGVKVVIGDKIVDGSVKGRLESLKKLLV